MPALLVTDDGPVRILTLNRPEARNAVNQQLADELDSALAEFEGRSDLRVGVISGSGQHFSTGMDLREFMGSSIPTVAEYGFAGLADRPMSKPLIAAVEGYALGGGFEIALCCDLIVAGDSARFGLPEVRLGWSRPPVDCCGSRFGSHSTLRPGSSSPVRRSTLRRRTVRPSVCVGGRRQCVDECRVHRPPDRRQWPACSDSEPESSPRSAKMADGGNVRATTCDHGPDLRVRRCAGRPFGIRRTPQACLAWAVVNIREEEGPDGAPIARAYRSVGEQAMSGDHDVR